MKRIFLAAAFLVAGIAGANAQTTTFGAGVSANLPIGDLSSAYSFGAGAEFQAEHKFNDNVSGIATTGFTHFFGKDLGGYKFNLELSLSWWVVVIMRTPSSILVRRSVTASS